MKPYRISIYSQEAKDPVMNFESDLPFMNFNVGDFIDSAYNSDFSETLGFTKEYRVKVTNVVHLIASEKGVLSHYKKIYTNFDFYKDDIKRLKE